MYRANRQEFDGWRCDRGPVEHAPPEALCGAGVKENYGAMLDLATRVGWVTGCGLPPTEDEALVKEFLAAEPAGPTRDTYLKGWETALKAASNGPDDPSFCKTGRARIEADAKRSRKVVMAALGR